VKLAGQTTVLREGKTAVVEPGVWHDWWNASDRQHARVRVEVTPGERFAHMIETIFGVATESSTALLVRPEVAKQQQAAEVPSSDPTEAPHTPKKPDGGAQPDDSPTSLQPCAAPKRFHGSVELDPTRVGRDAGRVADEVIAHLAGLVGAAVKVTLDIAAEIPSGAPDQVVRTVTENGRTLKFKSQGFEEE
jgi:hypothetical protein